MRMEQLGQVLAEVKKTMVTFSLNFILNCACGTYINISYLNLDRTCILKASAVQCQLIPLINNPIGSIRVSAERSLNQVSV